MGMNLRSRASAQEEEIDPVNSNRPNIVFILTDDQGPWAAGCYGNPEIRTPNLDRIAETGVRFENFFVAIPVCSPSRATFITGRIPSQHGVHDWIREGNVGEHAASYLKDEVCYTDILAENGWTCGISGKWHMGNPPSLGPRQQGFDVNIAGGAAGSPEREGLCPR